VAQKERMAWTGAVDADESAAMGCEHRAVIGGGERLRWAAEEGP